MAKKFTSKNINKLPTIIIVMVSFLSLAYFFFLFTRESEIMQTYVREIESCGVEDKWCYQIWHKYLDNFRKAQQWSLVIGLGLPVLFFSYKALIGFIFPEQKNNNF